MRSVEYIFQSVFIRLKNIIWSSAGSSNWSLGGKQSRHHHRNHFNSTLYSFINVLNLHENSTTILVGTFSSIQAILGLKVSVRFLEAQAVTKALIE